MLKGGADIDKRGGEDRNLIKKDLSKLGTKGQTDRQMDSVTKACTEVSYLTKK